MFTPSVGKTTGGTMYVTALTLQTVKAYAKALHLGTKSQFLVRITNKHNIKFNVPI